AVSADRGSLQGGRRAPGDGDRLGRGLAHPARRAAFRTGPDGVPVSPRLFLPTLGWVMAGLALIAVLAVFGRGLGLRWDPFNITEGRMEAAERRAEAAVDEARARRLEAEGAADQAGRLDHHHRQSVALVRATAAADAQARNADDAQVPLDPARAARLRAHD